MKRDAQTVVGDRAVYDIDQQIAVVTGKGLKLTTATDTVTARDSLEWYDQKQIAVARGDAVAVRDRQDGQGRHPDRLYGQDGRAGGKARRARPPRQRRGPNGAATDGHSRRCRPAGATAAESKISRVDAQGHVVVSNAIDTGRGDFGVYNAETGIATLIGNVSIQRGKDVISGQRGVMDLNNNVSRMLPGGAAGDRAAAGAGPVRPRGQARRRQAAAGAAARMQRPRQARRREEALMRSGPGPSRRAMPRPPGWPKRRAWSPTTAGWSASVSARASSVARCCARSASRCSAARWSGCSGRTAPARPPASTSSPA